MTRQLGGLTLWGQNFHPWVQLGSGSRCKPPWTPRLVQSSHTAPCGTQCTSVQSPAKVSIIDSERIVNIVACTIQHLFLCHVYTDNMPIFPDQFAEDKAVYPCSWAKIKHMASFHSLRVDCTTTIVPTFTQHTALHKGRSLSIGCVLPFATGDKWKSNTIVQFKHNSTVPFILQFF